MPPDAATPTLESTPAGTPAATPASTPDGGSSAGTSAPVQSLDELLAEGSVTDPDPAPASTPTPTTSTTQPPAQITLTAAEVAALKDFTKQQREQALTTSLNEMFGRWKDADPSLKAVDNDLIRDLVEAEAVREPRLGVAFAQRAANPKRWAEIETGLRQKVAKRLGSIPSAQITADRAGVHASVSGNSANQPSAAAKSAKEIGAMNDTQFQAHLRERFGA